MLMQVDKGVSKNYVSNERRSFFPSLQVRHCGMRHKSGKTHSSKHGNASTRFLHSSLFKLVYTFVMFLEMEGSYHMHGLVYVDLLWRGLRIYLGLSLSGPYE